MAKPKKQTHKINTETNKSDQLKKLFKINKETTAV